MSQKIRPISNTVCAAPLCDHVLTSNASRHDKVPGVVKELLTSWNSRECFDHISPVSIPSQEKIVEIVLQARRILFPGYFTGTKLHAANVEYYIGKETTDLYDKLAEQVTMAIRHDCRRNELPCTNCDEQSHRKALAFIESLPKVAATLATDIRATLNGDPATKSPDEVIFCYPGLLATLTFRLAHELYLLDIPVIPRIITEYAHSLTGIDIHPGATIGPDFSSITGQELLLVKPLLSGKMFVSIRVSPWEPFPSPGMRERKCATKNVTRPLKTTLLSTQTPQSSEEKPSLAKDRLSEVIYGSQRAWPQVQRYC